MMVQTGFRPWLKALLFWVTFLALYALRKVAPVIPVTLLAGVDESNFQHYKGTFFAYLIISLIEYLVFRRKVANKGLFWYARLMAAIFAPWLVFLVWYLMPALMGGKALPNVGLEIIFGNIATLLVGILAVIFERGFETITFSKSLKGMVWIMFAISILVYTLLTFNLPWADVFTEPEWQGTTLTIWRLHG